MSGLRAVLGAGVLLAMVLGMPDAGAGGRMQSPLTARTFATHGACVAELEALIAQDQQASAPRTTLPDGTTREVTLTSEGLQQAGPDHLRYQATLWFHHGRPRGDLPRIEISHNFETLIRTCKGIVLTIHGEKGFTLPTFEPAGR